MAACFRPKIRREVEMGAPPGKRLRGTKDSASPCRNDLGGYSILQAESQEARAETGHPQLLAHDGFELVEMPIPGMEGDGRKGVLAFTRAETRE